MTPHYTIISDGGIRQGRMYGSYQIEVRDGRTYKSEIHHFWLGTSNQAEYVALWTALDDLLERIGQHGKRPSSFNLMCITDSQLMRNQVNGRWRVRDEELQRLHQWVTKRLEKFGDWRVLWVGREEIVKVLGH